MNNSETFIILHRRLKMGGIETGSIEMMKNALAHNKRTIWVGNVDKVYDKNFSNVINNPKLEFCPYNYSHLDLYKLPEFKVSSGEIITIVCFDIFKMFLAFKIRKQLKQNIVKVLFITPHFTGETIFCEESFCGLFKKVVKHFCGKIYLDVYNAGSLNFFSKTHAEVLESTYGITLPNSERYLVPNLSERMPFNYEKRRKVFNKKEFTIISAGRFEFPHKGFLLGLVRVFAELVHGYPHIKLLIIGDGPDKSILVELINSLDENVKSRICLRPPVTPEELSEIMRDCNLNISVAGCATMGARCGVLTLPARHYNYDCEVYGFMPDSFGKTTSEEPGSPVKKFIVKTLLMTEDEYVEKCYRSYAAYDSDICDVNYPFNQKQDTEWLPSMDVFIFVRFIYFIQRLQCFFKNIFK